MFNFKIQCPPLNGITLGRHRRDNNDRMIQLTDVFCVVFLYNWASHLSDKLNDLKNKIFFELFI
jgi:hypothetical protein